MSLDPSTPPADEPDASPPSKPPRSSVSAVPPHLAAAQQPAHFAGPIDELSLSSASEQRAGPPAALPPRAVRYLTSADLRSSADPHDSDYLPPEQNCQGERRAPSRRIVRPLVLFGLTCFTTYAAGAYGWSPQLLTFDDRAKSILLNRWQPGLIYMLAVMGVLLAHEMGHFLMTVYYGIRSSYPIFIPLPVMMTGTMGAVIGMEGSRADRKQLFDIGIAGPLAGLVVTLPLVWFGIKTAAVVGAPRGHFGHPLLVELLIRYLRPDLLPGQELAINALYMAGWVGLLVTGLNMLPISQLDGGHVSHAVLGRYSRMLAGAVLIGAMSFIVIAEQYNWSVMVILVTLLGVQHPPTADDHVPIGRLRWTLGLVSLLIPIFCFTPFPFRELQ